MRNTALTGRLLAIAGGLALTMAPGPAVAHPHVWVNVATTVNYAGGSVTGLTHSWAFDDMYTAMAVQGLDANGDGTYSKEELAELAKVNIDSIKEFNYFTVARLGKEAIKFKEPTDYWLEHKDGILSLHFTMPFESPVLAEAQGLSFAVVDDTFYIAFDLLEKDPVTLAGAPDGCSASIEVPKEDLDQLQSLNDAFGGQLTAGNANQGMGAGYAKTVTLGCKKS